MKAKKKKYDKGNKVKRPSTAATQDQTAQSSNPVIRKNTTENLKNKDNQQLGRRIHNTAYKTKDPIPERGFKGYGDVEGARKMETEDYYAQKRKKMGIDKIKTYNKGGAVKVKYKKGGKLTEKDMDKMQKRSSDDNRFEYRGEDYMQQNASDIKSNSELLKFFRVKETAKGLEKMKISTRGMKPDDILKAGKTKGVDGMSSARKLFDEEIGKRKI